MEYKRIGLNEAIVDSKGRIVIPADVRKELGLNEGSKLRFRVEKSSFSGGPTVVMTKSIGPDEFIRRTEGVLKESGAKAVDPLRFKEMWGGV